MRQKLSGLRSVLVLSSCALAGAWTGHAFAQANPAQGNSGATITQAPDDSAPTPSAPRAGAGDSLAGLPSLVPQAGDPSNVDQVTLPEKPVAMLAGRSTWEEGFASLTGAFKRLDEALAKVGIKPTGRPIAIFVKTGDNDFEYRAMLPVPAGSQGAAGLPPEITFGVTPSGSAYRFVHKGPYDGIDSTYETITAYLDSKEITAKDEFIEEYANDISDSGNPELEINIFVQARDPSAGDVPHVNGADANSPDEGEDPEAGPGVTPNADQNSGSEPAPAGPPSGATPR